MIKHGGFNDRRFQLLAVQRFQLFICFGGFDDHPCHRNKSELVIGTTAKTDHRDLSMYLLKWFSKLRPGLIITQEQDVVQTPYYQTDVNNAWLRYWQPPVDIFLCCDDGVRKTEFGQAQR